MSEILEDDIDRDNPWLCQLCRSPLTRDQFEEGERHCYECQYECQSDLNKENKMSKKITFTGLRHDGLSALFELSPIRKPEGRLRMPLVVVTPDGLHMRATDDVSLLLEASDDCHVICVWPGKKRNDVFRFTAAQFLDHIKEHPKKEGQVI